MKFYPKVKSQTGFSSLQVSCKRALNKENVLKEKWKLKWNEIFFFLIFLRFLCFEEKSEKRIKFWTFVGTWYTWNKCNMDHAIFLGYFLNTVVCKFNKTSILYSKCNSNKTSTLYRKCNSTKLQHCTVNAIQKKFNLQKMGEKIKCSLFSTLLL